MLTEAEILVHLSFRVKGEEQSLNEIEIDTDSQDMLADCIPDFTEV
jgi:hypothetical protein